MYLGGQVRRHCKASLFGKEKFQKKNGNHWIINNTQHSGICMTSN